MMLNDELTNDELKQLADNGDVPSWTSAFINAGLQSDGESVDTEPEPEAEGYPQCAAATANDYDAIPDELKQRSQWALFNCTQGKGGHTAKIPYRAGVTGRQSAKSTDSNTWAPFDTAVLSRAHLKVSDIAFAFNAADPYTVVDLDDVIDPATGEVDPWAQSIIGRLDSYTEVSRSHTGCHIIVRATKPGKQSRTDDRPGFEIYDNGRFMICTGLHIDGTPTAIEERQAEIDALHAEVFAAKQTEAADERVETVSNSGYPQCAASASTAGSHKPLDDTDLLRLAMSSVVNGPQFTALWKGDLSAHNDNHSAADQALVNMLAYWTGKDASQMDRLFRKSGLMRPKWNELRGVETYGALTITKAIADTTRCYGDGQQPAKASSGNGAVSTPAARTTAANRNANKTNNLPPITFKLSEAMLKVLHGVAAFVPQAFNNEHDPLWYEAYRGRGLPLQEAARKYASGMEELLSHEAVFMYAQLAMRRISDDILMMIRNEGMPKDPVCTYSVTELMALDIPAPHFLPVLGEAGSVTKLFAAGLSHCITAAPSAGKTHFVAQSAMHWHDQPVIYCTEEGASTWAYRIRKYLEAGLPNNPMLQIKPCLGEGHKFILDTINAAPEGSIVIVDTLRAFANVEDEASGAQWSFALDPWCGAARKRNITLILIHHSKKGAAGKDPIDNASGSNSLMSRVEQRININEAEGHISVYGKGKNWVITPSHWKRTGDKFVSMTAEEIRRQSDSLADAIKQRMSAYDIITVKDLSKKLIDDGIECTESSIKTTLARMAKSGEAINEAVTINADGTRKGVNKVGRWRLATETLLSETEAE